MPVTAKQLDVIALQSRWETTLAVALSIASSIDVTSVFTGKTPNGTITSPGVILNTPIVISFKDGYAWVQSGRQIYGKLTESAGTWTLNFYENIAGVETSYTVIAGDVGKLINFRYQETVQVKDTNVYPEMPVVPPPSSGTITMATDRILGRTTAGSGPSEEIQVGAGLILQNGVIESGSPDTTFVWSGGVLQSMSNSKGTKTFGYSSGKLVSITGTGAYRSKTFTYDIDGNLESIDVSGI